MGVLQALQCPKKSYKTDSNTCKMEAGHPCTSVQQPKAKQGTALVSFSRYVQPLGCHCSGFGPLATCSVVAVAVRHRQNLLAVHCLQVDHGPCL